MPKAKSQNFQVNLGGIIELLSENLYSTPGVFARELMQNAADALSARRALDPGFNAEISVEVFSRKGTRPQLVFEDNGVGLTSAEMHRFLSTVGLSSKKVSTEKLREEFVGQFGIGLLSAFLVSGEITVVSRSCRAGEPAVKWVGSSDGSYTVEEVDDASIAVGTKVFLRAREDRAEWFAADRLEALLRHYGSLLAWPIRLRAGRAEKTINLAQPAWLRGEAAPFEPTEARQFCQELFEEEFLGVIPLESPSAGARGYAAILGHPVNLQARKSHRAYLKGMLVTGSAESVLPPWSFFLKAVVCARKLQPLASREDFREDATLEATRNEFAAQIREGLRQVATRDPGLLQSIIDIHHLHLKALAVEDDEFLRVFLDWLPFETTQGRQSFRRLREGGRIRFAATVAAYRQIEPIARAKGLCIVNAGYVYDADLLAAAAKLLPGLDCEPVDLYELFDTFALLEDAERAEILPLLDAANRVLRDRGCYCDARKFLPPETPVAFVMNDSAEFVRSTQNAEQRRDLFSSVLDSLAAEHEATASAILYFNYHNPVVRRLAAVRDSAVLHAAITNLYTLSLMLGHHRVTADERRLHSSSLLALIEAAARTNPA